MKKIFGALLIAVCIGMAMPAQAQIHFGVKGGLNLSKASFSNVKENFKKDNFTGFFIGPMAEFNIPIVGLGVDAALLFAQRGIKVSDADADVTVKQNGIDIPVNLKYNIGLGSLAGIYLAAGPDFYFDFEKPLFLYLCACNEKVCRCHITASTSKELYLLFAGRVCGRSEDRLPRGSSFRTEEVLYGYRS